MCGTSTSAPASAIARASSGVNTYGAVSRSSSRAARIISTSSAVAHPGLLEVLPEGAVEQADGREVLDAGEADPLQLVEEDGHQPERVGAADAGQHGRVASRSGAPRAAISTTIALASP